MSLASILSHWPCMQRRPPSWRCPTRDRTSQSRGRTCRRQTRTIKQTFGIQDNSLNWTSGRTDRDQRDRQVKGDDNKRQRSQSDSKWSVLLFRSVTLTSIQARAIAARWQVNKQTECEIKILMCDDWSFYRRQRGTMMTAAANHSQPNYFVACWLSPGCFKSEITACKLTGEKPLPGSEAFKRCSNLATMVRASFMPRK